MLRSLHIIGSKQMGGADQFYVRLVQALDKTDHEAIAVNRADSPIAHALNKSGVEQVHLPLANKWDLISAWRIRNLVRRRQPNIVQTYMGRATRLTRLSPEGRTVHVARLGGYYKIRGYYEHAHAWVGNTRGVCDYLIRSGLPARRVHLISNFVPEPQAADAAKLAEWRVRLQLPEEAMVLFTLGRFIAIKGFDDLLQAFARLPQSIDDRPLHLVIAGDGPLRNALHKLGQNLGLLGRLHWAGWQSQPGTLFHLADLVVCPSRHETLGNVILESWSYAKPVLATTTPGALELIQHMENGWLAPRDDPIQLSAHLHRALTVSKSERQRLALAGQGSVLRNHSRDAVIQRYLELYSSLYERRGD
jgi:glycosyltransferase involved in cell wall biosynthesis